MNPTKFDAIAELVNGGISGNTDGTDIKYHNNQTPPTKAEIDTKFAEMVAEYDAQEYARSRQGQEGYPSVGDQLDMLMKDMKNNTTTHREACEAVKAKYPKPS